MVDRLDDLLGDFNVSPSASESDVRSAEIALGSALPVDYTTFLREQDGGEGFIGEHYLILWKATELAPFNAAYEVAKYAPGLIMFGSTGGGEGFAFDTRTTPYAIVQVPFIGMSLKDAYRVADSFNELLQRMRDTDGSLF